MADIDDTILDDEAGELPVAKLLTDADLDDPERFVLVPDVPILDAHEDEARGDVDEDLLKLIADNTNKRIETGNYPPLLLGHTIEEEGDEHRQPPFMGVATGLRVQDYHGRPCLYADFKFKKETYKDAVGYVHRSVERMKSEKVPDDNFIDAVSLLRRAPARPLSLLTYARVPAGAEMVRYARAFDLARYCQDNPGSPKCACACGGKAETERYDGASCACSEPTPRADGAELVRECASAPAPDKVAFRKGLAKLKRYARKGCGAGPGGFQAGNSCSTAPHRKGKGKSPKTTLGMVPKVLAYLRAHPGPQTAAAVAEGLDAAKRTVTKLLDALAGSGSVVKTDGDEPTYQVQGAGGSGFGDGHSPQPPTPSPQPPRERYARVKPAAGQGSLFDEAKHPRDHGKFATKAGASDGSLKLPTPKDDGKPFSLKAEPPQGKHANAKAQGSLLSESPLDRSVQSFADAQHKPLAGQGSLPEGKPASNRGTPERIAKAEALRKAHDAALMDPNSDLNNRATAALVRRAKVATQAKRKATIAAKKNADEATTRAMEEAARQKAMRQEARASAESGAPLPYTYRELRAAGVQHETMMRLAGNGAVTPGGTPPAPDRYARAVFSRFARLVRYKAHPCGAGPEGFETKNTCGALNGRRAEAQPGPGRSATLLKPPSSPAAPKRAGAMPRPAPSRPVPSRSPLPASAFRLSPGGSAGRSASLFDKPGPAAATPARPQPKPPATLPASAFRPRTRPTAPEPEPKPKPLDPAALGHAETAAAPAGEFSADTAPRSGDFASATADTATAPIPAQEHGSTPKADPAKEKAVAAAVEKAEEGTADVAQLDPSTIHADPSRFQYKVKDEQHGGSVDAASGASGSTRDAKKWNPHLGGVLQVWKDPSDGKTYVVNGHNRLDLAKRLKANKVLVQYLDVQTPRQARMIGALTNIAEGHGTSIDAAKFFRDSKEEGVTAKGLEEQGLSLKGKVAAQGSALANLPTNLFNDVVNERLPLERASIIGGSGLSEGQMTALDTLAKKQKKHVTNEHLRELAEEVKLAGTAKAKQGQGGLFGDDPEEESLALHKTAVQANIKKKLSGDKKLFRLVSKSKAAKDLARAGNTINTTASGKVADEAATTLAVFDQMKNRGGPVAKLLNQAAARIQAGEPASAVQDETYKAIVAAIPEFLAGDNAFQPSPGAGGSGFGDGELPTPSPQPPAPTVRYHRARSVNAWLTPLVGRVLAFRDAGHFRYRSESNGVVRYSRTDPDATPDLMALSLGLQRIVRYGRVKPAEGQSSFDWDEDKHPRGMPENAGEFAPKGGGSKPSPKAEAARATEPEAPADPAEDYQRNGVKAKAFTAWFGDWENDPAHSLTPAAC